MIKNRIYVLFLLAGGLFSTSLVAEVIGLEPQKTLCESEADIHSLQLQQDLENWTTIDRRLSQSEYEQNINEIEASKGVFDYAMIAELIGFGFHLQEQQNHQAAANAFKRALHIIRINDGLYSTKQLPVIDLLIESNTVAQEWKQVADSYDMMYWLYRRNYSKEDPQQLNALKRIRRWNMESFGKDTGRSLDQLFVNAERLYEQAAKIMWTCTGGNKRQSLCFWHKACCGTEETTQGICPIDES